MASKVKPKEKGAMGADRFLSNRRSMKGSLGFNSSKRQDLKRTAKKLEEELEDKDLKIEENLEPKFNHIKSFKNFDF